MSAPIRRLATRFVLFGLAAGSFPAMAQAGLESDLRALVRLSVVEVLKHARSSEVIVSTDLLDAALLPEVPGVRLEPVAPAEIAARARRRGAAVQYLTADRLQIQPEKATVRLGYAWAYPSPDAPRAHAGPFLDITFRKAGGLWHIEQMHVIVE